MADERTVSTTDVVSYLDNGDPDYIFEIVDKTARANITSINTTLGKKRSIFYCDYFKFNSTDTTKTKQRYQFVGPYHKMTNGAKTFTAANLIAGDVCFSTEVRAYDGTTVIKRGLFALEYNYKSSSKYYSPAAYTYGAVDFDLTDRLPEVTSADAGKVLTVDSSGAWGAANPATELPAVTSSDENSVLAVDSSGTWAVNSDFNSRLDTVESNLGYARSDIEELQYDVDAVEDNLETLDTTVNDKISNIEDNYSNLESDFYSLQNDVSNLQDDCSSYGSSITDLTDLTSYMDDVGSSDYGKVLTYTSNNYWQAADVPKELPAVTSSDNGKVLKVASGAWTKAAETKELPSVTTSDNNKVLKVVSGAWAKAAAPTELPTVTSSDNGKVLGVANGAWTKTDIPTELPTVDDSDNQKILTVVSGDWIAAYPEPQLPTVSSADDGKILGVSSGDWTTINMPTELPAVTTSDNGKVLTVNSSGAWVAATPSSGGSDETLYAHIAPSPPVVFSKTNAGLLEDFITEIKNNWANFDWTNRHRAIIVGSNSMGGKHYGNAINVCWQFNSSTKPNELNVLEFDFMSEGTILHFKYNNSTYTVKEIVGTTTGVTYTDVSSDTGYNIKMTEFWLYQ